VEDIEQEKKKKVEKKECFLMGAKVLMIFLIGEIMREYTLETIVEGVGVPSGRSCEVEELYNGFAIKM